MGFGILVVSHNKQISKRDALSVLFFKEPFRRFSTGIFEYLDIEILS